jgi:hypothetical protein
VGGGGGGAHGPDAPATPPLPGGRRPVMRPGARAIVHGVIL